MATKQLLINEIKVDKEKKFVLILKQKIRKIVIGSYPTYDEAFKNMKEAEQDITPFLNKLKPSKERKEAKHYSKLPNGKYQTYIRSNDMRTIFLGNWDTEEEAKSIVELAKTDLEKALDVVAERSEEYYFSIQGKNYYPKKYGFDVVFKGLNENKKQRYIYVGHYKKEEQAKHVAELAREYRKDHDGSLVGVNEYINKKLLEELKESGKK